ncbi:MAG TPA: hypothetical protein VFQ53_07320 [Kofleriaceae bacterium]|nr:hypothetical protein [Kofleriaceae bacterium]
MTSRGVWVRVALGIAACGGATACRHSRRDARDEVLAKIPGSAIAVFASDGRALSHPRLRPVLDIVRPELPLGLGCVLDAGLTSRAIAIGVGSDGSITAAVDTETDPKCAVLSRIEPELWVATLGGDAIAARDHSVLASDALDRARPYLHDAPVAFTTTLPGGSLIATAKPEPLEAWLAYDTTEANAPVAERWMRARIDKLAGHPATAPFANVTLRRTDTQLVATLLDRGPSNGDLSLAVRTVLGWEHARPAVSDAPPTAPKQREVALGALRDALVTADVEPVMRAGLVIGLRFRAALPAYEIAAGDIAIAVDGRQMTSAPMFQAAVATALRSKAVQLTLERVDRSTARLRFVGSGQ